MTDWDRSATEKASHSSHLHYKNMLLHSLTPDVTISKISIYEKLDCIQHDSKQRIDTEVRICGKIV